MDVESPEHLERLRGQPEIKAALLRQWPRIDSAEVRFERTAKNSAYWPPINLLATQILAAGCVNECCESVELYQRPCWLIATPLASSPHTPYAIAVVSADGAPAVALVKLLRDVCHDYWHGSYFFK